MQYNITVEHQRWNTGFRISYIGTNTRQGEWAYNANQPVPDGRAFIDKARPFPRYPAISYLSNGAGHQYNSMTIEVERRMLRGFSYQASWVWARDIGDLETQHAGAPALPSLSPTPDPASAAPVPPPAHRCRRAASAPR